MHIDYHSSFATIAPSHRAQLKQHLTLGKDGTMLYRVLDWEQRYQYGATMPDWFFREHHSYLPQFNKIRFNQSYLQQKPRNIHIAFWGFRPVGWVLTDDFDHINMFVHPECRGSGIATRLALKWLCYDASGKIHVWNHYARRVMEHSLQQLGWIRHITVAK